MKTADRFGQPSRASHRRRLSISTLIAVVGLLGAVTPALAKVPYFTMELEDGPPTPGESIGIVVRMYEDAAHTRPADWLGESVPDVIAVIPEGGGLGESIPVPLERTEPAVYRGSVVIPSAGTWIVRPFPDASVWGEMGRMEGYPEDLSVQVAEPGPPLAVVAGISVLVAGIVALLARLGIRSARGTVPTVSPT